MSSEDDDEGGGPASMEAAAGSDNEGDKAGRDGDTQEFSEGELEAFGEHARSQQSDSAWARLVSVDKMFSNVELSGTEVHVGRADVVKANREEDMHVSKTHCRIWRNVETGSCHIQNISVNGTLVQGKLLEKDNQWTLHQGDEVCLGPHPSGCPLFVFQILSRCQHRQQKRGMEVEAESGSEAVKDGSSSGPDVKKPKLMENLDTFKCSICLNIWHDVISVTPCLHSFCNSCFSDWYRKSSRDRSECRCPQCRGTVSSVSRNHTLRSLVEEILKQDRSLQRPSGDILQMDQNSLFKGGPESQFQFGKNRSSWMAADVQDDSWAGDGDTQNSESLSSEEEEEEEEVDDFGCFQCVSQAGTFHCPIGQTHLICAACQRMYPQRTDLGSVAQKCELCSTAYCRTYLESQQHMPSDFQQCPQILALCERAVMDIPNRTHHGNAYEQEVTRRYLAEQGQSVQTVLREWLQRLDSGEADQHPFYVLFERRVSSTSAVCDFCAEEVFANLLDRFRTYVPKTELPPDAAGRQDCWYGYECRTQHHKEAHARKLNHVCDPSRQSSRRSSAVHL